ncbi:hypothetical protein [Erythrobacter donghaensis]|uniref:hypothetical protein n=1 Tax=Erythrobacter donghaensis TaxID=267135 RepID=UPI000A3B141B|nr:hypothetical protein [Erythrobacter donghaensis]
MSAQAIDRWRLTLALALPSLSGLAYLYTFGAPAQLIAVNTGALAAALAWIMFGRLPASERARLAIAGAAALMLFLPLLLGPEAGGVRRWIAAGPVLLHSGALLLPLIVVIAASAPRYGPVPMALAGAALALQPDAAALAGLAATGAVLAAIQRSLAFAGIAAAGAVLALVTFDTGTLERQVFTEGVLTHAAAHSGIAAAMLIAALFLVPIAILPTRTETRALAALLVAFGGMAVIAPFPFPLIGYGAAPILGFGFALGTLRNLRYSSPQA